ncbi:polyphenol oxidase family protein [Arthrobacter sp. GMC3]|uniref:polyphenol oxidase family protein n=1 Tax=Arthrobacter sp. GMC3 TaxID=2058894 RepID=UPI002157B8F2|nr:polyphenol oxidase family protein [Arthrobacter sp. GMC3]
MGFTDTLTGNLAFHVGDDPQSVTAARTGLDAHLTELAGAAAPVRLQYMDQVHGREVAVMVDTSAAHHAHESVPTADGMVSSSASLAVMVADCVPLVFVGTTAQGDAVLGVAHAGRPGVEAGVVAATVAELRQAGAVSLQAWLGPSVCGRCYEVPEAMRTEVAAGTPAAYSTTSWGTPALDLPAAVVSQLDDLGVPVNDLGVCTLEHPEFFSHRRAVRDHETEGRFVGFAARAHPDHQPALPVR